MPDRTHASISNELELADFRRSGRSFRAAGQPTGREVIALSLLLGNFMLEADFLPPFQLYYPSVVDHQLDRAVPNGLEGIPELSQEQRGERKRVGSAGAGIRPGRVHGHNPIYPI
jgi:hypothetical protein